MGERCNSTSSVRTHDCVDCSSLANEDRTRSSEDRKIARAQSVRKHVDAFKFRSTGALAHAHPSLSLSTSPFIAVCREISPHTIP